MMRKKSGVWFELEFIIDFFWGGGERGGEGVITLFILSMIIAHLNFLSLEMLKSQINLFWTVNFGVLSSATICTIAA